MFHSPKYWAELKAKRKAEEKKLEIVSSAEQDAEAKQEISRRIADTHVTWKEMEEFWKNGNGELLEKLIVYDAVIRAKLMYGLESLQLNADLQEK